MKPHYQIRAKLTNGLLVIRKQIYDNVWHSCPLMTRQQADEMLKQQDATIEEKLV